MIDINHAKRELKALSGIDSHFGEMCGEVLEYINSLEERVAIMTEGKPDDEECMAEIADHSELKRMKIKNDRLKNELERLRKRYCSLCKRSNYSKEKSVGGYCGVNCRYRKDGEYEQYVEKWQATHNDDLFCADGEQKEGE